jgi:flavorubredoxin
MIMSEPRSRGRGVVIFDSKFGNTEKVARSLASGLKMAGVQATCLNVKDVQVGSLIEYDLIAVGAPTQALTASKPIKDFLSQIEGIKNLRGKYGFAFDTRFRNRLASSGAKFIEKKLTQLGLEIIRPRQSAIVKKTEGCWKEGRNKLSSE